MDFETDFPEHHPTDKPAGHSHTTPTTNKEITIYTLLTILLMMKSELGLEAMMEYMDAYRLMIEKNNTKLKLAVRKALVLMPMERLYKNALSDKKD